MEGKFGNIFSRYATLLSIRPITFKYFRRCCRAVSPVSRQKVIEMAGDGETRYKLYRVVLTGGPCGGKTTGQARLSTFFENLGWKVFRAPESAFQYLNGGVQFQELTEDQAFQIQEDIIKTMIVVENSFTNLAKTMEQNVLLICDRGVMDGASYISRDQWEKMKDKNSWNEVHLRDRRYNQVIHMVSAAKGAESFYSIGGHKTRLEGLETARAVDSFTADTWVGHPYYDVIDNSTNFETKIARMIAAVCQRIGIETGDRLAPNSMKRKFLVKSIADDEGFPHYQEFEVVHDYLVTPNRKMQARLRKRGQAGCWTYTHTIRRPEIDNQIVELRMPITEKDYEILLAQRDESHYTIFKRRRCFLWNDQYFQMDIYQTPAPPGCQGLMFLEIFTTDKDQPILPTFLQVEREVTDETEYSMFNLSLREGFSS